LQLNKGDTVRLISDPGKIGIIRDILFRGEKIYFKVHINGITQTFPEYEIEVFEESESWEDLLNNCNFGRPENLRQHLTHIYLHGKLANLVYSMEATNTDFYAYQFKPVISFLESPSNGLLIADEVGLGKTIEAGLVWTEIKARESARRLLVMCPSMLKEKWRDELSQKFGEEAYIYNAEQLFNELGKNKHQTKPKVIISSIEGLRPPKNWRDESNSTKPSSKLAQRLDELSSEEPVLDMLIIDEAHYLRNRETRGNEIARLLTNITKNKLLLTATPINIHDQDLYQLLNLIDPDNFNDLNVFPNIIDANEPLHKARYLTLDVNSSQKDILDLLKLAQSNEILCDNKQLNKLINDDISSYLESHSQRIRLVNKIDKINLLRHTYTRTRKKEVIGEFQVIRQPKAEFIKLEPGGVEESFYNLTTDAIKRYAKNSNLPSGFLLSMAQRHIASCMVAAASHWKNRNNKNDIKIIRESLYETFGTGYTDNDDTVEDDSDINLIDYLWQQIEYDIDIPELERNDSKYNRLINVLKDIFSKNKEEKIIIFSYFRNTLRYLERRLREDNISTQILMGGMRESKQQIIYKYKDNPDVNILLSSEVASEGVDLQFSRILINYDLPWNPMKVEQRIGRIDRLGQKADQIFIWNLFHKDTVDEKIYTRLLSRLNIFERALGGVNDVVGPEIDKLTNELIFGNLTQEEEDRKIQDAALAIENNKIIEQEVEEEASNLIAHGGYILDQVQAAYNFQRRITDIDIEIYVKNYLGRFSKGSSLRGIDGVTNLLEISPSHNLRVKLQSYINNHKLNGLTRIANYQSTKIKFENKSDNFGTSFDYEAINQFHPLVRFISHDIQSQKVFDMRLIASIMMKQDLGELPISSGVYCFALNKWSFEGLRTEEDLRARILKQDNNKYLEADNSMDVINAIRVKAKDWLSAPSEIGQYVTEIKKQIDDCIIKLDDDFSKAKEDYEIENMDRIGFQKNSASKGFNRKKESLRTTLEKYESQDKNHRMIPATIGRINALQTRYETKLKELEHKQELKPLREEVCVGIFKVL
jgi:SNF2 family DNA or RNA helicase